MRDIGGLFASLMLKTDSASFDVGKKAVKGMTDSVKELGDGFDKFIVMATKGLLALGAAAIGAGAAFSELQLKNVQWELQTGLGVKQLNEWGVALRVVGANSDAVFASLSKLKSAESDVNLGLNKEDYNTVANMLGTLTGANGSKMDIQTLSKMNMDNQFKTLLGMATSLLPGYESGSTMGRAQGDVLEKIIPGIMTLAEQFKQNGGVNKTINEAAAMNLTNPATQTQGVQNALDLNKFFEQFKSIIGPGSIDLFAGLTPAIKDITSWMQANGPAIIEAMKEVGTGLNDVYEVIKLLLTVLKPFTDIASGIMGLDKNTINRKQDETLIYSTKEGQAAWAPVMRESQRLWASVLPYFTPEFLSSAKDSQAANPYGLQALAGANLRALMAGQDLTNDVTAADRAGMLNYPGVTPGKNGGATIVVNGMTFNASSKDIDRLIEATKRGDAKNLAGAVVEVSSLWGFASGTQAQVGAGALGPAATPNPGAQH